MDNLAPVTMMVGRVLLGLYFVVPGIMKFAFWDMHIGLMQHHNMIFIPFLLATAGIVQIVLGSALIINRYTAFSALILAGLVILININLHDFWNFPAEQQNFIKNMAIFGGLLVLSGFSWKSSKK
ncbi:DoxX [Phocoenobacter uteri]|uniref:DoxX n=2 Tax=Phocoenobacter uteri TaxID=146806 RepID=A0A379C8I3_9PAST|nr:hypothetical protein [Phocoenobacter uteri]SUB58692.1 DoxX [Phocoenobacter uteri]